MAITPLPSLDRTDPTFKTDVDDFFATELPTFSVEVEAARVAIVASEAATAASAATATTQAGVATSAATTATTQAGLAATSAAASAASAASAANAPGTSATSTTSLTIGTGTQSLTITTGKLFSVGQTVVIARTTDPTKQMRGVITSHNSGTGALVVSVPTGGTTGTGTFTDWIISLSGAQGAAGTDGNAAGGSTSTSMSSDLTLTSASTKLQDLNPTIAGLKVILPDATTMTDDLGVEPFRFVNSGLFSVRIVDSAGSTKAILGSGQAVSSALLNIATSAGYWLMQNISLDNSTLGRFYVGAQTAVSAQQVNNTDGRIAICALSAEKFLFAYSDSAAGLGRVLVVDLSATVPTYGTALTFLGSANPTFLSITAMSSTQAILCYMNGSTSEAKTINVSGSTCTAGAAHDYAGTAVNYNKVDRASATTAMVTYNTTGNNYAVKLLTVSGTSITSGTAGAIRSGVATSSRASTVLSATRGGIIYVLDSAIVDGRSATIDLSVNPPTINGDAVLFSGVSPTIITLTGLTENNNAIATYLTSTTTKVVPLNFGASSVVQGVNTTILTVGSPFASTTTLINGRSVAFTSNINTLNSIPFIKLSLETTAPVTAYSQVKFTDPEFIAVPNLGASLTNAISTSGKALYGFRNSSTTFANTVTQEIVG